jgi:hypothetical protein
MDIRATERIIQQEDMDVEEEEDNASEKDATFQERTWIAQCKREKSIGPKKVKTIVQDGLSNLEIKPYGYILVAACDFSKAARDAFREEMLKYGIQEYFIWGKAEIEDFLFLPKNDHLLFAYFGFSLQIRRRSKKTVVRSRLALKHKLVKVLGEIRQRSFHMILVRDPSDEEYPYIKNADEFLRQPRWRYWEFHGHQPPDHLLFVTEKYYAYVKWDTNEWDIINTYDVSWRPYPQVYGIDRGAIDLKKYGDIVDAYWNLHVPKENRAWALTLRAIHYDRILAVDEIGDSYNEQPHILVDYHNDGDPFEPHEILSIESAEGYFGKSMRPEEGKRISFFPKKIPDEREKYRESILNPKSTGT